MRKRIVYVTISGLTGTGKSGVAAELLAAMRAIGLRVDIDPDLDTELSNHAAANLDLLEEDRPVIVLREVNLRDPPDAALQEPQP